jgi:monooxygenase
LQSGEELDADIIASATGLQMLALGGVRLDVDGTAVNPGVSFIYKGVMLSNVPNFAFCVGYTNASWTLRADLASIFVCRLLNYMDRRGYGTCVPMCNPSTLDQKPLLDLTSGYVLRAAADLPKQSSKKPWFIRQNYILDMLAMKLGRVEDGILQFATVPHPIHFEPAQNIAVASSADD